MRKVVFWLAGFMACASLSAGQSARVVDSVLAGHARDEAEHHFAGSGTTSGVSAGKTWRSATGWFSYSLTIYDDSPLTVVCVLADGDGSGDGFDLLLDGVKAGRVDRQPGMTKGGTVELRIPFKDTKGKTSVAVKILALPNSRTPRVLEIRTVQEHLELQGGM